MKYRLPEDFGIEIYTPNECVKCEEVDESKKLGIKVWTPYSYCLIEGCNSNRVCVTKITQLLYFGLGMDRNIYMEFEQYNWNILKGEEIIGNIDELISKIKILLGYFPEKIGNYQRNIPKYIEILAKGMILGKVPGKLVYPLTRVTEAEIEENPVTGDIEVVEYSLKIPGNKACICTVSYETSEAIIVKGCKIFLDEDDFPKILKKTFFYSFPEKYSNIDVMKINSLLNSWIDCADQILVNYSEEGLEKFINVSCSMSDVLRKILCRKDK